MKTLNKMKTLLGMLALTAVVPTALSAQKPIIYGYPMLDREAQAPLAQRTDPVLTNLAATADGTTSGLITRDGSILVEANGTEDGIRKLAETLAVDSKTIRLLDSKAPTMRRMWVQQESLTELMAIVAKLPDVELSAYRPPVANSASEGAEAMRAIYYTAAGLDGAGVTVAVLDSDFSGLDAGSNASNQGSREDTTSHGAAMVDVVRDIAPGAKIATYRLDENLDVYTAAMQAIDNGADVIVCALTWFELPAQGLASDAARMAQKHDVIWVNAAGNFADGNYQEGQDLNTVDMTDGTTMVMFENAMGGYMQYLSDYEIGGNVTLHFGYEKPSASDGPRSPKAALALEVYSWDEISGTFYLVGSGNPEMDHQVVSFEAQAGLDYFPMVRVAAPGAISRFRLFSPDARLYYSNAEGSMANPAAVQGVISVGAVTASNYNSFGSVEQYSSQGGGIFNLSLSLCGPTDVSTGTYGPQGFSGTSAAAASVAGLMALQLQDPMLSKAPTELLRFTDMGDANAAGKGLVMAMVDDFEPDNDAGVRQTIFANQSVEGHMLSPSNDIDWFNFSIAQDLSVDVELDSEAEIAIYNEDLSLVTASKGSKLHLAALAAGNYKLALTAIDDGDPRYSVTLNTYQGAPDAVTDLTVKVNEDGKETITAEANWSRPAGLGKITYILEVAADEGFVKEAAKIELEDDAAKIGELDANTTWFARIIAKNEFGESKPSKIVSFTAPKDSDLILSGSINDKLSTENSVAAHVTAAPLGDDDAEQAAGCVGTTAGNGLAILLLALVAGAAGLRLIRRKEVIAE